MKLKTVYRDAVLKPLERLDLKEGEVIEIEICGSKIDRIVDLLGDVDVGSLELQHGLKEIWVKKSVSY